MAQNLEYDRSVESELSAGNRYAESGHLLNALKTLGHARASCAETYAADDIVGVAHGLRIRRDIAALDARIAFKTIIPSRFLNDRARTELETACGNLLTARAGLASLAFTPEGIGPMEEHLHSEAGLADIWRGRIMIAMGVLSLTEEPRQRSYTDAGEILGSAKRYVLAGNNKYYAAELFGQIMRLRTLTGNSRSEALRGAERAVASAAVSDRANLYRALVRTIRYGLETTPAKIESAIRQGRI